MITIELDSHAVNAALNTLAQNIDNMYPAFDDIGVALVFDIRQNLGRGESPWGIPFDPLLKPRRRGTGVGDIPLNDTRQHIYNRITHNADRHSVDIGMIENVLIGQTHQFGSEDKNIPARPFLPIWNDAVMLPPGWEQEVIDIINRHMQP